MFETSVRYAPPARWLHWLTAALVLVAIFFGLWIKYFEPHDEPFKLRLYNIHESIGFVIFFVVLIRLLYRWRHPAPPLPFDTPPAIRVAAHVSHAALYALLVIMPILGFMATNAWGFPLKVFDVLPIPAPYGKNEALAKTLSFLHLCGAIALISVIGAHLMGVIYHTFIRRDRLIHRML
ncbi:MAG TPA: cytochrome b [Burkholderiales bacterium]|nr:cytochrome b [Burkholderiales bacterium]